MLSAHSESSYLYGHHGTCYCILDNYATSPIQGEVYPIGEPTFFIRSAAMVEDHVKLMEHVQVMYCTGSAVRRQGKGSEWVSIEARKEEDF